MQHIHVNLHLHKNCFIQYRSHMAFLRSSVTHKHRKTFFFLDYVK